ncbi:Ger(x)C family spore germination protein [Paenibacillus allorhizosphaerae]|uniref:Spore germination protein B3 n=1 Tax=Paenibacillus allorhizosphaerae TaxID=2849866 RepID=A0ABM8VPW6_9BACL|nr:Ger(x)C family spore germination protein [Paenibacillus allorhizosphaerae]CAG7653441.1 Spore germination protein B3 [Paenibacillus allorhizosphaerae]
MKRIILTLLLLPWPLLCIQGCWDRTEINDLAFILTSAVDMEQDGRIRYTVMLPLPGQMGGASGGGGGTGGEKSYYIDSEIGETVRDAQAKLQARMSRRMFLAHRRTLLVGEEYARSRGIRNVFDSTPRSPESRMTTNLIITKGKAYELLQSSPRFERFPSEAIRELAKSRMVLNLNMKDTAVMMSSTGGDTMVLYMSIKESEKSEKTSREIMNTGYALFKGDKMVGIMEEQEAIGLSMLKRLNSESIVTVNVEEHVKMTTRINRADSHIRVHLINGKPHYDIGMDVRVRIVETIGFYDLSQTANIRKVENILSDKVTKAIEQTIRTLQKKEVDPVQFGNDLWRAYPKLWNDRYASEWPSLMKDAEFNVKVNSIMTDTGLIYENITKKGLGQ